MHPAASIQLTYFEEGDCSAIQMLVFGNPKRFELGCQDQPLLLLPNMPCYCGCILTPAYTRNFVFLEILIEIDCANVCTRISMRVTT